MVICFRKSFYLLAVSATNALWKVTQTCYATYGMEMNNRPRDMPHHQQRQLDNLAKMLTNNDRVQTGILPYEHAALPLW